MSRRSLSVARCHLGEALKVGLGIAAGTAAVASFGLPAYRFVVDLPLPLFRNPTLSISLTHTALLVLIMSKATDPEVISNFLADQRDEAPADVQHLYLTFEDLWERKLWHQLTDQLLEFFSTPESKTQRLPLYNTFIISFADKINQLKLVKLALVASEQCQGMCCVREVAYGD